MTLPDDDCQEESYIRIKVLGKGAFGEAVLYRKPEVCTRRKIYKHFIVVPIYSRTIFLWYGRKLI